MQDSEATLLQHAARWRQSAEDNLADARNHAHPGAEKVERRHARIKQRIAAHYDRIIQEMNKF